MKKQIRVLGIDDSPFDKFRDKSVLVVGTLFRGGEFLDGILSTKVNVDGNDATFKLIEMINNCKFKQSIHSVLLDGIALGGFNIVDIERLFKKTKIPVIVVMRDYPDLNKIKKALNKIGMGKKIKLLEKAGEINSYEKIFFQVKGISEEKAKQILKVTCTHSHLPEPVRVAHLIGQGLVYGESRGRA
ncbi:DUF99 family protein [Candidatus Woesearchaeota archaeon]|nr:DUF99 family protein [Candidatus Woesearchaeota archaeon]